VNAQPAKAIELFVDPKSMPIAPLLTVEDGEFMRGLFNSQVRECQSVKQF
jgi:hypothetical protein